MKKYDVVIIGFGKAGKTLAAKLSKSGKTVALVEKDAGMYGGTCINVGCIPSKRLITDAEQTKQLGFEEQRLHYKKSVMEKRSLTAALRQANYDKLVQSGVDVIDGTASFLDQNRIQVETNTESITMEGKQFVINTGSRPVLPDIPGVSENDHVYVSETLMDLEELPEHLTIIGGGYIGLEFASMYTNFGSKVTIVQNGDVFLPREDADIAECIRTSLETRGIHIITGAQIESLEESTLHYTIHHEKKTLNGDAVLLAAGRRPNTDDLHAENAGIRLSARGAIETDSYLRTGANNIWAAGDVCGKRQFTYISLDDSRIILSDMNGKRDRTTENRGAFAYSVFIDPPFSRVGLSEAEAKAQKLNYRVVSLPAHAIPKAKVLRKTDGMLKAIIRQDDQILGAELFCAESHEMINTIKLAMDHQLDYTVLKDFIFTHPTMSESLNDLFSL